MTPCCTPIGTATPQCENTSQIAHSPGGKFLQPFTLASPKLCSVAAQGLTSPCRLDWQEHKSPRLWAVAWGCQETLE